MELLPGIPLVHTEELLALRADVRAITGPFGPESTHTGVVSTAPANGVSASPYLH